MLKQLLNGDWQFRQAGNDDWLPATVPGGVHTDLLALGKIPDRLWLITNSRLCGSPKAIGNTAAHSASILPCWPQPHVSLVCDGLDTIADVYVNGTWLGHAENMFRRWEWDVKPLLRAGENVIRIFFGSPLRFIAARQAQLP